LWSRAHVRAERVSQCTSAGTSSPNRPRATGSAAAASRSAAGSRRRSSAWKRVGRAAKSFSSRPRARFAFVPARARRVGLTPRVPAGTHKSGHTNPHKHAAHDHARVQNRVQRTSSARLRLDAGRSDVLAAYVTHKGQACWQAEAAVQSLTDHPQDDRMEALHGRRARLAVGAVLRHVDNLRPATLVACRRDTFPQSAPFLF